MDLAALATPTDRAKLQYLQRSFAETLRALEELNFPEVSRRDARPVLQAASEACIYDGEYAPVVRKYYAFRGDFSQVWFTLDLFTIMPDDMKTARSREEVKFIVKQIVGALIGEVRLGLREELQI
jgi:hypothetical protein